MRMPRYPVYVPTKGRHDNCLTARFLIRDNVPFYLVVEPQEREQYLKYGEKNILVLPFSNQGKGSIPARNWIKEHATKEGHPRHWQLDDNIRQTYRIHKKKRVPCASGVAFAVVEDFVDRYENVAIAGLEYEMFGVRKMHPFTLNCRVYSCSLVNNAIPHKWRGQYNEDADLCLQVLADGWCTDLFNAFLCDKQRTMTMGGGNTKDLYQGDGRLKMARSLERVWPHIVTTDRRFQRPQHIVRDSWCSFKTPLIRKKDIDFSKFPKVDDYGMKLKQINKNH